MRLPGLPTESVVLALLFSRLFSALSLRLSDRTGPGHRATGPRSWTGKLGLNKLSCSKYLVARTFPSTEL